ncbi:hypothetical protein FRC00_012894 [Tulasnella sp. 408]|nr:hypothetical protein FRC00_012894 [Tulasnella sp. 408]
MVYRFWKHKLAAVALLAPVIPLSPASPSPFNADPLATNEPTTPPTASLTPLLPVSSLPGASSPGSSSSGSSVASYGSWTSSEAALAHEITAALEQQHLNEQSYYSSDSDVSMQNVEE